MFTIISLPFFILFIIAEFVVLIYLFMGARLLALGRTESNQHKIRAGRRTIVIALIALVLICISYLSFNKWFWPA
jgi:hypothetical protein